MFGAVASLECALGDPLDATNPFSYERALERDEREAYGTEALAVLDEWGLGAYYVPRSLGGRLDGAWELGTLVRAVARRDCAVAAAHTMALLAAVPVWQSGGPVVQARMSEAVLEGHRISIALHERDHGSDLQNVELRAGRGPDRVSFMLDGEKWCVGNTAYAREALVYARTGYRDHGRDHSLFFVALPQDDPCFAVSERLRTQGVRSHHVGGFSFSRFPVEESSLVGAEGGALEAVLRASPVTKALAASLSLGALETGLKCATEFTSERRVYGKLAIDLPYVQAALAEAWTELWLGEALWAIALKGLHFFPRQAALVSSAAKVVITSGCERALTSLSGILGARAFLREGHPWAIFGKAWRDSAFPRLGHYNAVTNLQSIAAQLGARQRGAASPDLALAREAVCCSSALPPLDFSRIPSEAAKNAGSATMPSR